MKKFMMFLAGFVILLGATSCTSCNKEKKQMETMVEQTIKSDRAYMCKHYGSVYKWFECQMILNDYLDGDCDGTVAGLTNVFQVQTDPSNPKVVLISHTADVMHVKEVAGFWVEDYELETAEVKFTYRQAFERMMKSNYVKPHSKNCTLRKELGPYDCNPQYIFGNIDAQLYVDATTSEVRDISPAFNPKE